MGEAWDQTVRRELPAATVSESFGELTADVEAADWLDSVRSCHDALGLVFFDWLSAVDETDGRFSVVTHLYDPGGHRRLLVRTQVTETADAPGRLPTLTGVYAGASWHERETFEMFGIGFEGHPNLVPLLLPDGFEGRPLRKSFVLAARVAKPWPGAKEPGESGHSSPGRRKTLPPGVPDPSEWGPRAAPASGVDETAASTGSTGSDDDDA